MTIFRPDDGLPRVAVPGVPGRGGRAAVQEPALHAAQGSIHRHPPTHPARRPQVTHLHLISNIYLLFFEEMFTVRSFKYLFTVRISFHFQPRHS